MLVADVAWIVLAVLFVSLEIVSRLTAALPRLSALFALFGRSAPMRVAILCGWVWLGWHFFAR